MEALAHGAKRMEAKRMGAKRMGVKTPVLTDERPHGGFCVASL